MKMCPIQSLPCETFYELNISEKKKKCTEVSVNHFEHLIFNLLADSYRKSLMSKAFDF